MKIGFYTPKHTDAHLGKAFSQVNELEASLPDVLMLVAQAPRGQMASQTSVLSLHEARLQSELLARLKDHRQSRPCEHLKSGSRIS